MHSSYSAVLLIPLWVRVFRSCPLPQATNSNTKILHVSWIIPGVDSDARMRAMQTWKSRRVYSHSLRWELQHCSSQVAGTAHSSGSGRSSAGSLLAVAIYYRGSGNALILQVSWIIPGVDADAKMRANTSLEISPLLLELVALGAAALQLTSSRHSTQQRQWWELGRESTRSCGLLSWERERVDIASFLDYSWG